MLATADFDAMKMSEIATEAAVRRQDYWLVVVGNVESNPVARLITDPAAQLQATCRYQTTIAASWRATVTVA